MWSSSGWPWGALLLLGKWALCGDLFSGAKGCVSPADPLSSFGLGLGGSETLSPSPYLLACHSPVFRLCFCERREL